MQDTNMDCMSNNQICVTFVEVLKWLKITYVNYINQDAYNKVDSKSLLSMAYGHPRNG